MAGALIQLPVKDGAGVARQGYFWSDSGDVNGNLTPVHINVDSNGAPVALALDASIQTLITAATTPAPYLPPDPLLAPGDLLRTRINDVATTDFVLAPATAGQRNRIYRLDFISVAAVTVSIWDGPSSTGTKLIDYPLPNGGSIVRDFCSRAWFTSTAGNALIMTLSAAVNTQGACNYAQSAV